MKNLLLILITLLIFLIIAEMFCRYFIKPIYTTSDRLNNFRVGLNNNQRDGLNIAMLGDSFTYGVKVKDNETSSYYLSIILRDRLNRNDIYVDNYGIAGTSTIEQYLIFEKYIADSRYDFVVLNFFIDDFTPYYYHNTIVNPYFYCRDFENSYERILSYLNNLVIVEFSLIYIDLIQTYYKAGAALTPVSYMLQKMREKDSLRYRCAKGYLIKMGNRIKESGKKGIFLLLPSLTLYDYQNPYPEEIVEYETEVLLTAKRSGFETIDAVVELREQLDQRLIIRGDIHYNSEGYRLIATLIADRIMEMIGR